MNEAILKKYETEIYPFKVWVAIAQDRDEILKKFVDYTDGTPVKDVPQTDFVQCVEETKTGNYGALIVFYDESRLTHRTVTHEVIHAVGDLLQCIGDEISGNEQTAYLAGWIAVKKLNMKLISKKNMKETHTIKTNLKGLKKWAWRKNLTGFFSVKGKELSDAQVRKMVDWAIAKGYEYDAEIPVDEVIELLNIKS